MFPLKRGTLIRGMYRSRSWKLNLTVLRRRASLFWTAELVSREAKQRFVVVVSVSEKNFLFVKFGIGGSEGRYGKANLRRKVPLWACPISNHDRSKSGKPM